MDYTSVLATPVDENVLVGKLGPNSIEKWKLGKILKSVIAVAYLVKVDDKIMHKHVNSLRKYFNKDVHFNPPKSDHVNKNDILLGINDKSENSCSSSSSIVNNEIVEGLDNYSTVGCSNLKNGCASTVPLLRRSTRIRKPPDGLNL
ncbi:hypothetical protein FQR65_LT06805 [Abscondita terminalis]|nr:hypothetical protein FQR65_LT06805 [Abscondita terminalis]